MHGINFQAQLTFAALLTILTLIPETSGTICHAQSGTDRDRLKRAANPGWISESRSTGAKTAPPPSSGFRPIGSPSRVDPYKPTRVTASRPRSDGDQAELAASGELGSSVKLLGTDAGQLNTQSTIDPGGLTQPTVAPAAFAQDGFTMPSMDQESPVAGPVTGRTAPPVASPSAPPATKPSQPNTPLRRDPASLTRGASPTATPLPQNQSPTMGLQPKPSTTAGDLTQVPQPQLNSQWSTTGNSPLVTSPSGYRAVFWDCSVPSVVQTTGSPYVYAPPTVMPNAPQSLAVTGAYPGYRPLFSLGQENFNVQLGQGIIGQPTVYVPGQPIRNFFRYLSP